jgi:hypothetical protein
MSVWASTLLIGDDGRDDGRDLQAPLTYRQSHVLPSHDDPRGGLLDLASIPAFVTRDGYDDGPDDGAVWPFLRVSVRPAQVTDDVWVEDTVVLDHRQVLALRDELTVWLQRVDFECPTRHGTPQGGQPMRQDSTHLTSTGTTSGPSEAQLAAVRRAVARRREFGKDDTEQTRELLGMLGIVPTALLYPDAPPLPKPDSVGRRGRGPGAHRQRAAKREAS